jgi:hypothetical protein
MVLFVSLLHHHNSISHPDIRVKHCAYGHSVATLLNPRCVTTISHKYCVTAARHETVIVAVPSTVHYAANYEIKISYLRCINNKTLK